MNDNHIETKIHYPVTLDGNETVNTNQKISLINSIDFTKSFKHPNEPHGGKKNYFQL